MSTRTMAIRPKRSFGLKLLVMLFLITAIAGGLRVYQAISDWEWLIQYGVVPGPGYFVLYGAVQCLVGLIAGAALWLRQTWAPWAARGTAILLAAWYWADRLLLTQSSTGWTDWPFSLGATLVLLAYTFLVLAHPRQR